MDGDRAGTVWCRICSKGGVVVVFRGLFSSIQCFGIEVAQNGRRKEGWEVVV